MTSPSATVSLNACSGSGARARSSAASAVVASSTPRPVTVVAGVNSVPRETSTATGPPCGSALAGAGVGADHRARRHLLVVLLGDSHAETGVVEGAAGLVDGARDGRRDRVRAGAGEEYHPTPPPTTASTSRTTRVHSPRRRLPALLVPYPQSAGSAFVRSPTAPLPTAPLPTAPLRTAPLATAPLATAPVVGGPDRPRAGRGCWSRPSTGPTTRVAWWLSVGVAAPSLPSRRVLVVARGLDRPGPVPAGLAVELGLCRGRRGLPACSSCSSSRASTGRSSGSCAVAQVTRESSSGGTPGSISVGPGTWPWTCW